MVRLAMTAYFSIFILLLVTLGMIFIFYGGVGARVPKDTLYNETSTAVDHKVPSSWQYVWNKEKATADTNSDDDVSPGDKEPSECDYITNVDCDTCLSCVPRGEGFLCCN